MVAHTPLKTPTAVAAWLTERMAQQDGWLEEAAMRLAEAATRATQREQLRLERMSGEVIRLGGTYCERAQARLAMLREQLSAEVARFIDRRQMFLATAEGVVEGRKPDNILRMGFAIVRCDGRAVSSAEALAGREVEIELAKGKVKATVK